MRVRVPFMPEILARTAPLLGAEVLLEPGYGFVGLIRFPNGRKSYFWDNKFNLNSVSAVKICGDKAYTTFFLRTFGYRTPDEQLFARESFRSYLPHSRGMEDARRFAESLGWPVFVKPPRLSQGDRVMKAHSAAEFEECARAVFERSRVMIVQRAYEGNDYRIVVLDGEVISAYRRIPLTVAGDGVSTITGLLRAKQAAFDRDGRDTVIPVDDPRIARRLQRLGLGWDSVPADGAEVRLLDVANLSLGGTTQELTGQIHPTFAALAANVARDLDLRLCGVDLLAPDLAAPLGEYVILEVNSAPGLDNYAWSGARQQEYVDSLYLRVLQAIADGPPAVEG